MIECVKESKSLIDLIYAIEPLSYYFGMKPKEFWNSTYREVDTYIQANICYMLDDFRQEIQLQETVTDKLIMSNIMSSKKPKIISIKDTFKSLFSKKTDTELQSSKEITRRMRGIMSNSVDKK